MFDTILIANRGEIACRVMQTAQAMGVRCVAVYSDADAGAKHVAMADLAVQIGGAAPAESYLRGDRIIQAALDTGAQAIHPGYGFLSENPDFVEAVAAAGLTFIGPSAEAIRAMGLKDAAKKLMEEAGVPVVPGYHGADQDPGHLEVEAAQIGYPVLIKAVAGGGGKGMRKVDAPEAFVSALESAKAEARTAFGNDAVLIEKFVDTPRHIEVQVFGDGTRAVHLFERDCSLQRRHQKVIEEAPAPGMTPEMRAAMGQAAVRAAEAIGYKGAGTIEFIVDGSDGLRADGFWFMEMNTRLQVEHPITEAITGVDLVDWQLRVASGEPLPATQDDLRITGHAFEARLYAEDVPKGFLPATGTLAHLAFPPIARSDSGVRAGDAISPWYDPMIAKVITYGSTRAVALTRMAQALRETEVGGTVTNLAFLGALVDHAGFAAGDVDTGLIDRDLEALVAENAPAVADIAWAAIVAAGLEWPTTDAGFTLWHSLRRAIPLRHDDQDIAVELEVHTATAIDVHVGETVVAARHGDAGWRLDGASAPRAAVVGGQVFVFAQYGLAFDIVDPLDRATSAAGDGNVIEAPMPGLVKALYATPGQNVNAGDRLAVLEAMKMEHALLAARDGVVAEVLAAEGAQVEAGAALVRLEEEDAA
ncbi:acetyl/propionyl/methylcrotonyl-CoA carboxylase subunit alpha [Aestuariivita sp.]|jgi:3-methylcrotonyl-CoA carboxylase alpha subunit|uniref:acetyl/propionyl/methylcrotonyl-CoA carboxylase subunit alpha n=1 Tax=Aestuariivita sp. TaxID=1872407 RepID=UPI002171ABD0|nr:acetyl/propionyl/methylcrotonyl-CoA carboxylase subunit alpha [Aestuariivita sp.]MCE8008844.1 acetyl/propionyl/methylcrotonyl-CoA carboxylase subunit alpha [Aestuariivita sp.]